MNPNKAPGPNGINIGFIKKYLRIMKNEMYSLFSNFIPIIGFQRTATPPS